MYKFILISFFISSISLIALILTQDNKNNILYCHKSYINKNTINTSTFFNTSNTIITIISIILFTNIILLNNINNKKINNINKFYYNNKKKI